MASSSFDALIGTTPEMRALLEYLGEIANSTGNVLLRGETGTGRHTLARAIHDDTHAKRPFVVVDVAATSPTLVASTLFGYEVSTFLAGLKVTRGAFEAADSGTLVLREVAAIPRDLQPVLAETLRTRRYTRVGSASQHAFTTRLISTTHADLEDLVREGVFDLALYRALTMDGAFTVPPLRDRLADLPALAARFAKRALDSTLVARLAKLPWPGNVGELQRAVAALVANPKAIIELELLAAIAADPDDDGPRLVYGDVLSARNDPRGELVQIQCRLAAGNPEPLHLPAAERKLLEAHHVEWTGAVIAAGATPTYTPNVTLRRGFVEHLDTSVSVLRNLEAIVRVAPMLQSLDLDGTPKHELLFSPLLRRIRALRVNVGSFIREELGGLATCPYLSNLRALTLLPNRPGAIEDRVLWLGVGGQEAAPSREAGARALSTSPHLANVRSLALDGLVIGDATAAILLNKNATWRLQHLSLVGCELGSLAIETLVEAVHAPHLRSLDLRENLIGVSGILALAAAKSLSALTTLRVGAIESSRARIALQASQALAGVAIYCDGELLAR